MAAIYDRIGTTYRHTRGPDPRIRNLLDRRIGSAGRILNIGAGTGSYEPGDGFVVAVEPSSIMLQQRSPDAAPAVRAVAEKLPFTSGSFDLALAILSIHHWGDWRLGVSEALRISDGHFVTLTWVGFPRGFWLNDYFPEIETLDLSLFPGLPEFEREIGQIEVDVVPIPHDCKDGFLCAYWRRPNAYLDSVVRQGMSTFSKIPNVKPRLRRLQDDLSSGKWEDKYGEILDCDSYDYGYRIVSCGAQAF